MKVSIKKVLITLLIIIVISAGFFIKGYIEKYNIQKIELQKQVVEKEKIAIDEYNLEQLEKVKSVLDKLDKNSYSFENLKEFNNKYGLNIKPIKNCYFLSDRNRYLEDKKGGGGYLFGTLLVSNKYINKYRNKYYSYPKYDMPKFNVCVGKCYDLVYRDYIDTISNPCEGNISGYVFEDINMNGKKDEGEKMIGDAKIYIDEDNNSKRTSSDTFPLSKNDGYYKFDNVWDGLKIVKLSYTLKHKVTFPKEQSYTIDYKKYTDYPDTNFGIYIER